MEQLIVRWSNKALSKLDDKSLWYLANCGETFVKTFVADVEETVATISQMPGVGVLKRHEGKRTYRLFHNHPKCAIYYWYDATEVHIIDLIFAQMQRKQ